jgi:hypothetical protein
VSNNLRVLYDNLANKVSTLTASTTAGGLIAANMLTDRKSEVHRSTGTSVQYDLRWTTAQLINMLALAFCNLTSSATMRVRGYTNVGDATPAFDTGANLCCPYQAFGLWDWGSLPLGVNAYSYGGAAYGVSYFATANVKQLLIDVADASNSLGYIEVARLVTGVYWSPQTNASWGAGVTPESNTQHERSEAGDLRTERRPMSRSVKVDLSQITSASDRQRMYDILRGNGMTKPVFLSLYPEDADVSLEQSCQIYGKLKGNQTLSHPMFGMFSSGLEIEEV